MLAAQALTGAAPGAPAKAAHRQHAALAPVRACSDAQGHAKGAAAIARALNDHQGTWQGLRSGTWQGTWSGTWSGTCQGTW